MPRRPKPRPKAHARSWGEGSIREVRPGVWRAFRARVHRADGSTLRPSQTFSGPQAEALAAQWAAGAAPSPDGVLLGDWLSRWLKLRKPTISPNTHDKRVRFVQACAPLAGLPMAAITAEQWQGLANELLGRWSRDHVASWRKSITTALRAAMPAYLTEITLARVILPRRQDRIPKAWHQDEVDRLLAAADGAHAAWLHFAIGTGVRLGEARALLWEDVDLVERTATIRASLDNAKSTRGPTKTGRIRTVEIPDEVIPVLAEHRKRQRPGEAHVFGHDGHAYQSSGYRKWLARVCRQAGVRSFPPHSARHTCASLAFDAGVPVQDIARQLGHSVSMCQKTYWHWIGAGQRRMAGALGAALSNRFSGPQRETRAARE
jgi:integrase